VSKLIQLAFTAGTTLAALASVFGDDHAFTLVMAFSAGFQAAMFYVRLEEERLDAKRQRRATNSGTNHRCLMSLTPRKI
jgi:hypothetical protein